jgi:hypothetical protein
VGPNPTRLKPVCREVGTRQFTKAVGYAAGMLLVVSIANWQPEVLRDVRVTQSRDKAGWGNSHSSESPKLQNHP